MARLSSPAILFAFAFPLVPATRVKQRSSAGSIETSNIEERVEAHEEDNINSAGSSSSSMEAQMAQIAVDVYSLGTPSAGWTLTHGMEIGAHYWPGKGKKVGIYQKDNQCAVAFSGTQNLRNVWSDAKLLPSRAEDIPGCGIKQAHEGFAEEFIHAMIAPDWTAKYVPFLRANCAGGIHTTGHSLGGAIASLFAACANFAKGHVKLVQGVWTTEVAMPFRVSSLYSIGAPHVSIVQLSNHKAPNGVFAGARMYNQDNLSLDPIPWGVAVVGDFKHPKVLAVALHCAIMGKWSCSKVEHEGDTTEAADFPRGDGKYTLLPNVVLHAKAVYVDRAEKIFG